MRPHGYTSQTASRARRIHWELLVSIVSLCLACERGGAASGVGTDSVTTVDLTAKSRASIRIVCFDDKTSSTIKTVTPQLSENDFQPLLDVLLRVGGELAYGSICSESDLPLLRLFVPEPPATPKRPLAASNAFERHDGEQVLRRELATYEAAHHEWLQEAQTRIDIFEDQLARRLNRPVDCGRTDMHGAAARAALFLGEPDTIWSNPPAEYVIFVSDGLDNVRKPAISFDGHPTVLVVNGSASLGAIGNLHPLRFESIDAAFGFIATTRGD